jgi:uncharacterized membrane protein
VIVFILIGILIFVMGAVLYLGKIPPNRWFGFRTPDTLANKDLWYKANRYLGRDVMILVLYWILVTLIINNLKLEYPVSLLVWVVSIWVGMFAVIIRGLLYLNRFN